MGTLYIIILVGLPVLALLFGVGSIFYDIGNYIYYKITDAVAIAKPLRADRKAILKKYFFYYNRLSKSDQKKFEERVNRFLHSKRFIGRGIAITEEMKVLTSATAVLLSFSMPMVMLANFDKILMYPDAYYSGINRRYHLGEVNPRLGMIILSWKSFVDGFIDNADGRNLAFHEMAHALHFENAIKNSEYNFLDENTLELWDKLVAKEIVQVRNDPDHFLRAYAGTNHYEFFAVAVEYFYENAKEFQDKLPFLYNTLKRLLKQDPITLFKF